MKPFRALISLEDAMRRMEMNLIPISRTEEVALDDSSGRVLAKDIIAEIDVPSFDRSAMDGYAVRAEDSYGASQQSPARLKLVESLRTEIPPTKAILKGECVQLSTGSSIPEGADSVVMYENTDKEGGTVLIYRPVHPGENVSKKGSDLEKGKVVLRKGDWLTPAKVGVLAAIGVERISVYAKPRIAVLPTGGELVEPGTPLSGTSIYDINSHTLVSVIKENGGTPITFEIVPDERDKLEKALVRTSDNDMVVLTGGSSVGDRDIVYDVLKDKGEILFHGIQVKPGKPTLCGLIGGKIILAMPGHPTSCLSNAYLLLVPVLRRLARLPEKKPDKLAAKLARRVVSTLGRRVFLAVKVVDGEAVPVFKESSAITSMAEADGYIVVPENTDTLEKGDAVEVHLFK